MNFKSLRMAIAVLLVLFQGCQTAPQQKSIDQDEPLKRAAMTLAQDYLEEQIRPTEGTYQAMEKFGMGAITIPTMQDYYIDGLSYDKAGNPIVIARTRIGTPEVGIFRKIYHIVLHYWPKLREQGDKYLGLRIQEVRDVH